MMATKGDVTSYMVSDLSRPPSTLICKPDPASRKAQTVSTQDQPKLPTLRPHDGRNDNFINWIDALHNVERDLRIDIADKPPSTSELVSLIPHCLTESLHDFRVYQQAERRCYRPCDSSSIYLPCSNANACVS